MFFIVVQFRKQILISQKPTDNKKKTRPHFNMNTVIKKLDEMQQPRRRGEKYRKKMCR